MASPVIKFYWVADHTKVRLHIGFITVIQKDSKGSRKYFALPFILFNIILY